MSLSALASPFEAMSLVLRIGSIGVAITCLESLSRPQDIAPGGIVDPRVQLSRRAYLVRIERRFPRLLSPTGETVTIALRLLAALSLIAGAGVFEVARFGALIVAITTISLRARSSVGTHSSGALVTVIFAFSAIGLAVGTNRSMGFALGFIAAEAALAYFVNGLRKLQQPEWRGGRAISANATTIVWGSRRSAVMLRSHPGVGLAMCWATIAGECIVPLALVAPLPVSIAILACAGAFHAGVAVQMGLGCFFWSFTSSYPAIFYCWYFLH